MTEHHSQFSLISPSLKSLSSGWVDKDLMNIRRMAVSGASVTEMATEMGWSETRVLGFIKRNHLVWNRPANAGNPNGASARLSAPEREKWQKSAVAMRQEGAAISAIAAALGVNAALVGTHLRNAGVSDPKLRRGPKPSGKPKRGVSDRQRSQLCADAIFSPSQSRESV